MRCVVLKPFGWYPDGYTRQTLEADDELDFGDVTDGLIAAGFIARAKATAIAEPEAEEVAEEPTVEDVDEPSAEDKPRGRRRK